jgi:hypothetical protein
MAAAVTAAADPGFRLYQAADTGDVAAVKQLLDDGADVMWADAEGTTALMKAAESGHQAIVAELLDAGAPWNQQDNDGYCAGEYATASKNQDIVELIMEWGVQAELMLMAAERWVLVGSRKCTCCCVVSGQVPLYRLNRPAVERTMSSVQPRRQTA